ncbi:nucleotidyltransferase domain-containing protein [Dyella choica]|uniref:Nucleotidyltransferase domain-containing protein n=1 Tax=Dyella choica TaxID=1927959 RepID=A0A3S0PQM0_9GAMM|nr:nucleotidyltransferase domain-containing protein [Dyella choica]RUL78389.1 nucleotidyltransferase domain-containing protein [Dyella choica]
MPSTIPQLHTEFLERVRSEVARDTRLNALLAGGSYIHGGFDPHSDLDFVIVVEDDSYPEVMASRQEFAHRIGDLLSAFTGEHVGEPRLLICLYGPSLIHVDLKFVTSAGLGRLVERPAVLFARNLEHTEALLDAATIAWPNLTPEWFEQRAWIWLHYGATKLARGELFETIGILGFFREQVLGPMLHRRAGRPQRGVRRMESMDVRASAQLARTVATHDAVSARAALLAAIDLYVDLRSDEPPREVVRQMPEALFSHLKESIGATQ